MFCLVYYSPQTLGTQLLSSLVISLIHQSPGCHHELAAGHRLHRYREINSPYQQVTALPRFPLLRHVHAHHLSFFLALYSTSTVMDSSQASHRPRHGFSFDRHGLSKTKTLLLCSGDTRQKMDLCFSFRNCMARHENGICRHGRWTDHDRLSFRYKERSTANEEFNQSLGGARFLGRF